MMLRMLVGAVVVAAAMGAAGAKPGTPAGNDKEEAKIDKEKAELHNLEAPIYKEEAEHKCCGDACHSELQCSANMFCCPNHHVCMDVSTEGDFGPHCDACCQDPRLDGQPDPRCCPGSRLGCPYVQNGQKEAKLEKNAALHKEEAKLECRLSHQCSAHMFCCLHHLVCMDDGSCKYSCGLCPSTVADSEGEAVKQKADMAKMGVEVAKKQTAMAVEKEKAETEKAQSQREGEGVGEVGNQKTHMSKKAFEAAKEQLAKAADNDKKVGTEKADDMSFSAWADDTTSHALHFAAFVAVASVVMCMVVMGRSARQPRVLVNPLLG